MTYYIDTAGKDASPTVRAYYRRAAYVALTRWQRRPVQAVTLTPALKRGPGPTGAAPIGVIQ